MYFFLLICIWSVIHNYNKDNGCHFSILLHQMFLRTHSALDRTSPWRVKTLWSKVFSKETEIKVLHPETTRKECLAGRPVHSSLRKSWKHSGKLIGRAGMWWWVFPMRAASGAAARVKSVPFAENLPFSVERFTCAEMCTLSLRVTYKYSLPLFSVLMTIRSFYSTCFSVIQCAV